MPLKNSSGETEGHIFYMAYTPDGQDAAKRPLTFGFNGGPGSAALWCIWAESARAAPSLKSDGSMPPPPYRMKDMVAHAFSEGFHPEPVERLAAYWAEALGGPALYSDSYGDETAVVRMHSRNGEHEK